MSSNEDVKVYQDKKAKAEDFKSSAYTLLIVGVVGLVALILMATGVLPFRLAGSGRFMTYGVMGTLFIIFIVTGIFSFKSSKQYEVEAVAEDDMTEKIQNWAKANLSVETITENVYFEEDTPDEMKYFKYFNYIKEAVKQEFGNLNASYLEAACEELYAQIFESGEQQ